MDPHNLTCGNERGLGLCSTEKMMQDYSYPAEAIDFLKKAAYDDT
jgi:hypothetical protein